MKKVFNLFLAASTAVAIFSCRNNDVPVDTHDHDEISKTTVTIVEKTNPQNMQVVNYPSGKADKIFTLEKGKTYTVGVEFFIMHDGKYETAMDEIEKDKEEHFIAYEFVGSDVNIIRIDDEKTTRKDGTKIGVRTEWTINSTPKADALFNIKLYHKPISVNQNFPSPSNQCGKVEGNDIDVNAVFKIK